MMSIDIEWKQGSILCFEESFWKAFTSNSTGYWTKMFDNAFIFSTFDFIMKALTTGCLGTMVNKNNRQQYKKDKVNLLV